MGRKAKEYGATMLELRDPPEIIADAINLSRWKAHLAIEWMELALLKANSPIHLNLWNKGAEKINSTIDSIEKYKHHDEEYWNGSTSRRLPIQEVDLGIEDWLAIQAFIK
mgnify:CR=1 FL=1|jgi:hypothetical protein